MKALILLVCMLVGCTSSRDFYGREMLGGNLAWASVYEDGATIVRTRNLAGDIAEHEIRLEGNPKNQRIVCLIEGRAYLLYSREAITDDFDEYAFERKFYKHKIRGTSPLEQPEPYASHEPFW